MNFQHFLQKPAASPVASITKIATMVMAVTVATTMLPITTASAGGGHHHRHHSRAGDVVLGGIIGLTIGAIAEESNRRRYHRVRRHSYQPYYRPSTPIYDEYNPEFDGYARESRPYGAREPRPSRPYAARESRPSRYRVLREPRPGKRYRKRKNRAVQRDTLMDSDAPKVITYNETASIEPWSAGWQDYCKTRYRSFNSKSGTFLGYDGDRHFCVAK